MLKTQDERRFEGVGGVYNAFVEHSKDIYISVPEYAERVRGALANAEYEAWYVGGFVRDALMGRACHDVDIATNAHWTCVQAACEQAGMQVRESGVKHGTVTVLVPAGSEVHAVEVTTFRTEGSYSDGRRPDEVHFVGNIQDDLARRDFTMNAIAFAPGVGVVDPFGGVADISAGIIRVVGAPEDRFKEDALRILRACRFASQLGFSIDGDTLRGMEVCKRMLENVSRERITQELDGFLLGQYVHQALMETWHVLAFVLPELVAMAACEQRTKYHCYTVLEHTAWALQYVEPERLLRWAALCHDMGKPACSFFDDEGIEHFYGHAGVSAQLARGVLARMCVSPSFADEVCLIVERHNDVIHASPKAVRRALAKVDGRVDTFKAGVALKRADILAHAPEYAAGAEDHASAVLAALAQVEASDGAFTVGMLAVNGGDVLALGVPAGPKVGDALRWLLEEVLEERLPNERGALLKALQERVS